MKTNLLLIIILFTVSVFAHEDQLGSLQGENLGLYYTDHAISGHVKGQLIFAVPFENEFGIKLTQRIQGKQYESEFKKSGNVFSGQTVGLNSSGVKSDTEIKITKVSTKENTFEGMLGEEPFTVTVSAKSMEGHHYVNPEFTVTLPKTTYHFKLENGMACMGCATKIVYVVLGTLRATGSL